MDQNDSNSGWNAGTTGSTGTTGGTTSGDFGSGSTGSMGGGSFGAGSTDSGTTGASSFGVSSATETEICPHCGQSMNKSGGLEQFLGRLGINDEMLSNLKGQFQNVDIDEYLNTARDYLKGSSTKAGSYAKENPGKVAAGVAALALGAGLIYAAVNREK